MAEQIEIKVDNRFFKSRFIRFESAEAYADYLREIPNQLRVTGDYAEEYGLPYNQAIDTLLVGDTTHLEKAEAILATMQDQDIFTYGLPTPAASVVGNYSSIPAVLAGHPKAMRRRVHGDQSSMNAPISIYIEVVPSGALSGDQFLNRGIATLAFVLVMQQMRPVELYTVSSGRAGSKVHAAGSIVKINSKPIHLGQACYMLTSTSYARRLGFSTIYEQSLEYYAGGIGWEWSMMPENKQYQLNMREACNMGPNDILLSAAHALDRLALTDPVAWVKRMVSDHKHIMETNEVAQ